MEFISKHGIKIQVAVLAGLIVFVATVAISAGRLIREVDMNTDALAKHDTEIKVIPVLKNDINTMKEDIGEIKGDVKDLLKR